METLRSTVLAVHEAAHAVISFIGDIRVGSISITSNVGDGEMTQDEQLDLHEKREEQAMVALAGRAAQIRVEPGAKDKERFHRDWADDMRRFDRHLEGIFTNSRGRRPTDREMGQLDCAAWDNMNKLLDHSAVCWAICAAALTLQGKGVISGDEFRDIVKPLLSDAMTDLALLMHFTGYPPASGTAG